jgi:hypothetical protein
VVEALRDKPEFLAGWLARTPGGTSWISERLGLGAGSTERLLVCRAPRPSSFSSDVGAIAKLLQIEAGVLAAVLREAAAVTALSAAHRVDSGAEDATPSPGLLAAARDVTKDTISWRTGRLLHLRRLADDVRARAPRHSKRLMDVEALVAWAAPLAVVVLPELNLSAAHGWLHERGVALGFGNRDRPLRGLLLAWRGSGVIFVDGSIATPDRRFTVAHELGHFLLDYLEPRTQVLRTAPELVEVLDGHRNATTQDRARAVLEGLQLGVHAHLLDRDPHGGVAWDVEQGEDLSSRFALELLSPWEAVRAALRRLPEGTGWEERIEDATRILEERFHLPADAARARAVAGLESVGKGPGFFDR